MDEKKVDTNINVPPEEQNVDININSKNRSLKKAVENVGRSVGNTAKTVGSAAISTAKNTAKNSVRNAGKKAVSAVNPFDKPLNNDVSDTSSESIKLAYKSVKKGKNAIKTAQHTVKTTQRTIKTASNAVRISTKAAYRTAAIAVKTTTAAVHLAATVTANAIAIVTNPIVIIIAAALMIFVMLTSSVAVLFSGDDTNKVGMTGAVGLGDVKAQYEQGIQFYNIALRGNRDAFYAIIDGMRYNYNDLGNSDLVYMEKTNDEGGKTFFQKAYADDSRKQSLKNAWECKLTEMEIISIAYVYAEKKVNDSNGTSGEIYDVAFTQDLFNEIINKCVNYSNTVYQNQPCMTENCTVTEEPNPDFQTALDKLNESAAAYNDWLPVQTALTASETASAALEDWRKVVQLIKRYGNPSSPFWNIIVQPQINLWEAKYNRTADVANSGDDFALTLANEAQQLAYDAQDAVNGWLTKHNRTPDLSNSGETFRNTLGKEYEDNKAVYDATPQTLKKTSCPHKHNYYSLGLFIYSKEDVMNALNFTATDIDLEELTELGFQNNPEIQQTT